MGASALRPTGPSVVMRGTLREREAEWLGQNFATISTQRRRRVNIDLTGFVREIWRGMAGEWIIPAVV